MMSMEAATTVAYYTAVITPFVVGIVLWWGYGKKKPRWPKKVQKELDTLHDISRRNSHKRTGT